MASGVSGTTHDLIVKLVHQYGTCPLDLTTEQEPSSSAMRLPGGPITRRAAHRLGRRATIGPHRPPGAAPRAVTDHHHAGRAGHRQEN